MDLQFEIGDPQRPRGHAILYFRVDTEPDHVYGNLHHHAAHHCRSDQIRPALSWRRTWAAPAPAPWPTFRPSPCRQCPSWWKAATEQLVRLANIRNDDLVYGGSMFSYDLARMMESVAQAVQEYADAWFRTGGEEGGVSTLPAEDAAIPLGGSAPLPGAADGGEGDSLGVNEVLWSFMSEGDRLAEMGRLLGRLRFAQEGNDAAAIADIIAEMTALGRHLPDEFGIASLVDAANDTTPNGVQLAQLYLDRCYRLSSGDTEQVRRIDEAIKNLQRRG